MKTNKRLYCLSFGLAGVLAMTQPFCLAQEFFTEVVEVEAEEATPSEVGVTVDSGASFIQVEPVEKTKISETITNFAYSFEQSTPVEENAKLKPIRIFCKVLDHQLSEVLGNDYASPSFLSEGCRGYWIPPNDVLITLNVSFPVRVEEKLDSAKENEKDTSDLWNLYEKQASSGKIEFTNPTMKVYTTVVKTENMQEKVNQLKKTITDVISKYGLRLKQEFPFDHLSIVINGGSGRNAFAYKSSPAKKVVNQKSKEALESELENLKRIQSLKKEQLSLAEENLKRIQQQSESGRASISEVDQAKEKLAERKIEYEKQLHEMTQLGMKHIEISDPHVDKGYSVQFHVEGNIPGATRQMKKVEDEWVQDETVRRAIPLEVKFGAPNSTMIFQIKGEQITDAETIQNNIQITSY